MGKVFENIILNNLYEKRKIGFEENFLKECGEVEETREVQKAESKLTSLIKEIVKDKNEYNKLLDGLNEFEESVIGERVFWNEQYYKLGFIDALTFKKEIKELRNNFPNENNNENKSILQYNMKEILDFIENEKAKMLKNNEEYKSLLTKQEGIKNKYPKIQKLIEEQENVEIDSEETKALIELINIKEEMTIIEMCRIFELGIKEITLL